MAETQLQPEPGKGITVSYQQAWTELQDAHMLNGKTRMEPTEGVGPTEESIAQGNAIEEEIMSDPEKGPKINKLWEMAEEHVKRHGFQGKSYGDLIKEFARQLDQDLK